MLQPDCLANTRLTCDAPQTSLPRGVRTPRAVSAAAICRSDVAPARRAATMYGSTSAARFAALRFQTSEASAATLLSPLRSWGFPSTTPRVFAAARAARVRALTARASSSATNAIMPMVSRLACGMSAATNSTPAFSNPSRKCASRARRSSLAINSTARRARLSAIAVASCGRSLRLPLSTSSKLAHTIPPAAAAYRSTAARWASSPSPERPCRSVLTR